MPLTYGFFWILNMEHGTFYVLNPYENQEKQQQKQAIEIKALILWLHITIFQLKYVIGLAKNSSKIILSNEMNEKRLKK